MVDERANTVAAEAEVAAVEQDPPPHPETKHRRPRVREVSSRFMSPVASSSSLSSCSSANDLHLLATKSPLHRQQQRSTSVQRQRRQLEFEPLKCADENIRSSETPLHSHPTSGKAAVVLPNSTTTTTTLRKNHQRKHAKENGEDQSQQQQQQPPPSKTHTLDCSKQQLPRPGRHGTFTPSRTDTPIPNPTTRSSVDRIVPSRFKLSTSTSAAGKLLQSSGLSVPAQTKVNSSQNATHSSSSSATLSDLRSSMPEADMLPTVSNRLNNAIASADSSKFAASPFSRSLNLPPSISDDSPFHPLKGNEKPPPVLSKSFNNSLKTGAGGLCLPPVPPNQKLGADARKGRKVSNHQEDVHSLKMLHNHYLQWRFANCRAEACMQSQKREAERTLYSLGVKMSNLYESVSRKRIELAFLKRVKTLTTILEAQMPYLEEWSTIEGDYSLSLSEATQALLNASIQLPVRGNLKVDLREVGEALSRATKLMENIVPHVQCFVPKAEEVEILISAVARTTDGERALIEECGDLLSRTYNSQVEECYLRSELIQLHQRCGGQFRKDEQ